MVVRFWTCEFFSLYYLEPSLMIDSILIESSTAFVPSLCWRCNTWDASPSNNTTTINYDYPELNTIQEALASTNGSHHRLTESSKTFWNASGSKSHELVSSSCPAQKQVPRLQLDSSWFIQIRSAGNAFGSKDALVQYQNVPGIASSCISLRMCR